MRNESRRSSLCLVLVLLVLSLTFAACSQSEGLGVYPKAMGAADEASAIQTLRTIASAQGQYYSGFGKYGDFAALTQAGMLDERFASSSPNLRGYQFTMSASETEFSVNADPKATEKSPTTGVRHFYLESNDNAIHVNVSQSASKNDPLLAP